LKWDMKTGAAGFTSLCPPFNSSRLTHWIPAFAGMTGEYAMDLSLPGVWGVSHTHLHPLPSRERNAYMEVQEELLPGSGVSPGFS
jgi:hypothetical protein